MMSESSDGRSVHHRRRAGRPDFFRDPRLPVLPAAGRFFIPRLNGRAAAARRGRAASLNGGSGFSIALRCLFTEKYFAMQF